MYRQHSTRHEMTSLMTFHRRRESFRSVADLLM